MVKVEKDETKGTIQMLDPLNEVVLETQESETGLVLENWDTWETTQCTYVRSLGIE